MKLELLNRYEIEPSFRVDKVRGMFDVDVPAVEKRIPVDIPIEDMPWHIGLIVGPSGTGKTTIARRAFDGYLYFTGFEWSQRSVVDDFPVDVAETTEILGKVGFASPPDWLKPFHLLSNGEQMRAELARVLVSTDQPVIYDEFTSVVDRQVAQFGCAAVSKFIRSQGKQFIAVTCHRDVAEWLGPDWVYDTKGYRFSRRRLRRPPIELEIRRGERGEWALFRDYHYLTAKLPRNAENYVAEIGGEPVAWCSIMHFPHPTAKRMKRLCRTVVLPDYQGLGIGGRLSSWVAAHYRMRGYRVTAAMSNPQLYRTRMNDPAWRLTRKGKITTSRSGEMGRRRSSENRITATFEYVGSKDATRKEANANAT